MNASDFNLGVRAVALNLLRLLAVFTGASIALALAAAVVLLPEPWKVLALFVLLQLVVFAGKLWARL